VGGGVVELSSRRAVSHRPFSSPGTLPPPSMRYHRFDCSGRGSEGGSQSWLAAPASSLFGRRHYLLFGKGPDHDRATRESLQKSVKLAIEITTASQEQTARQLAEVHPPGCTPPEDRGWGTERDRGGWDWFSCFFEGGCEDGVLDRLPPRLGISVPPNPLDPLGRGACSPIWLSDLFSWEGIGRPSRCAGLWICSVRFPFNHQMVASAQGGRRGGGTSPHFSRCFFMHRNLVSCIGQGAPKPACNRGFGVQHATFSNLTFCHIFPTPTTRSPTSHFISAQRLLLRCSATGAE